MRAATPVIYILIQGQDGPPPPPSAVRAHLPLLSAFLPQQVDPPLKPSAVNSPPLPQILAFPLQLDVPPLQPLSACDSSHMLSVSLQGRGVPPLLPSAVRAYATLIWKWEVMCAYHKKALFCDTRKIDTITVLILHNST